MHSTRTNLHLWPPFENDRREHLLQLLVVLCMHTFFHSPTFHVRARCVPLQEKQGTPSAGVDGAACSANSENEADWSPCLYSVEGETVYDFAW